MTGPPPDGLRLELPAGRRHPLPANPRLDLQLPAWFELGGPAVAVSFLVDALEPAAREAALTTLRIVLDRVMDQLRHRNGWLYETDFVLVSTPEDTVACLHADPPAAHADDVRGGLLQILRELRDSGPTDAELAEDLAAMREVLDDPRAAEAETSAAAAAYLLGRPWDQVDERLSRRASIGAAECRRVLERLEDTLIVGMPPDVVPADPRLHPEAEFSATTVPGRAFRRNRLRGRLTGLPRRAQLVVGDRGASLVLPDGPITVRWEDLVGAGTHPEHEVTTLVGVDGFSLSLSARWFSDGQEAMALIDAQIPTELRYTDHLTESDEEASA